VQPQQKAATSRSSEAETQVDAALIALARLLGRQAAREDHAAALKQEEKTNAESFQDT
jgi:hypothetical protein